MVLICLPGQGQWAAENLHLWLAVNFVMNGLWIFIWTSEQTVLAAIWLALLVTGTLVPVYRQAGFASEYSPLATRFLGLGGQEGTAEERSRLQEGPYRAAVESMGEGVGSWVPVSTRSVTRFGVSLYLGWCCVATIVAIAVAFTPKKGIANLGWNPSGWGMVVLSVATVLSLLAVVLHRDWVLPLPIGWALIAIHWQLQPANRLSYQPGTPALARVALGLGITCLALAAVGALMWTPDLVGWVTGQDQEGTGAASGGQADWTSSKHDSLTGPGNKGAAVRNPLDAAGAVDVEGHPGLESKSDL